MSVAILGHSFIRRIHESFRHHSLPANYDLTECEVIHMGLGGLCVCGNNQRHVSTDKFKRRFDNFLTIHKPQVVVIQLGENDIDCGIGTNSGILPLTVASTLEEIGILLLKDYSVKKVVICELFTRLRPRNVSVEEYEAKRRHANSILKTLLESHPSITFWSHRRLFGAQTQIFAADGVHLTQFGQYRFYRSLRHAVMRAVKNST